LKPLKRVLSLFKVALFFYIISSEIRNLMNKFCKIFILIGSWFLTLSTTQAQSIITTVAGSGTPPNNYGYSGDNGQATNAELYNPNGITTDALGNLYIADSYNNRVRIVNTVGIVITIAGNGTGGYSGDNGLATTAELNLSTGVAIDSHNNIYIADFGNNVIRKINTSGTINTIAGTGTSGYSGDGGQSTVAELSDPRQLAFDTLGNLYFSDQANNVIRKINVTTGIISTFAGNGTQGYSGDGGGATSAQLYYPTGLHFDKLNNLYIADEGNNVIRKINASTGIISTFAGNGTQGYSGDGGQATVSELSLPEDAIMDNIGNLYIADGNNVIRKVNTAGVISTIAGIGTAGYSGDGGTPISAKLNAVGELSFDASDNLYLIDFGNQRIRKISNVSTIGIEQYGGSKGQANVSLFPNPNTGMFEVNYDLSASNTDGVLSILDLNGKVLATYILKQNEISSKIDASTFANGMYMYSIQAANIAPFTGKLVIIK
jgi:type IX secretion system substrate protein/NHL repeat-containing protein